jgi:transcriptional regulator with XRE-family HTH domain
VKIQTASLPIGRALRVERIAAGLRADHVARAIGISPSHLSHIEAGRRTAGPEMAERIRQAINELKEAA